MEHVDAGWRSSGMEKHGDKDRAGSQQKHRGGTG